MHNDNRCMYMTDVCFFVCCSDGDGVSGNVCCVAAVVKYSGYLSLGVLKYVVCLCSGCDGCCVFCLYCEAWSCRWVSHWVPFCCIESFIVVLYSLMLC